MNYDVVNAYVAHCDFQDHIRFDFMFSRLYRTECYDKDDNCFLLKTEIGIKADKILDSESPASEHYEEIEKYLYKQYDPLHRAYIVFAILYGLPKEDIETLAFKKNKHNAGELLDDMLCKDVTLSHYLEIKKGKYIKINEEDFFQNDGVTCFRVNGKEYSLLI